MEYIEETFEAPTPKEAFELAKSVYKDRDLKLVRAKHKLDSQGKLISQITIKVPLSKVSSLQNIDTDNKKVDFVLNLLAKRGLDREWLKDRLNFADGAILSDEKKILNYIIEELDRNIYIKKENFSKKRLKMLIGTTGVGKTTTLVKLAARYAYMLETEYKVAILNLDTYKAGAGQQLEIFSNTLLLDYFSAESPQELKKVLEKVDDFDIVLADSAGISPKDTERLIRHIEFIKEIKDRELELELVIPANFKYEDILEIYEYFSFLDISSIIITKLDETTAIGDLVTFLAKSNLPVSYLSFGQKIPDDLALASKNTILDCFVGDNFSA
jgi:flagellar biosynthesis protein FlhF